MDGRARRLVHVEHRRQRARRGPDHVERAALALLRRQRLRGPGRRRRQPLRVAQPLPLGEQRGLLGRIERRRVGGRDQLLELGPLPLGPTRAGPAPRPGRGRRRPGAGAAPAAARRPRDDVGAREGVEHRELAGRAHEPPVLVLGGEPHQGPRERRHGVARRGLAVDHRPRPALRRHPARQDHLVLVLRQLAQRQGRVVVLQPVPEPGGHRERGLHQRLASRPVAPPPRRRARRSAGRAPAPARSCPRRSPR